MITEYSTKFQTFDDTVDLKRIAHVGYGHKYPITVFIGEYAISSQPGCSLKHPRHFICQARSAVDGLNHLAIHKLSTGPDGIKYIYKTFGISSLEYFKAMTIFLTMNFNPDTMIDQAIFFKRVYNSYTQSTSIMLCLI